MLTELVSEGDLIRRAKFCGDQRFFLWLNMLTAEAKNTRDNVREDAWEPRQVGDDGRSCL